MNDTPCHICVVKTMCKEPCDEFMSYVSTVLEDFVDDVHFYDPEVVIDHLSRTIKGIKRGWTEFSLFYSYIIIYYRAYFDYGEIIKLDRRGEHYRIGGRSV